jgi:lipid-A-disaccharide synthase
MRVGSAPRIYLSTGEPSGDLHGEGVVRALQRELPDAVIEATGGPRIGGTGAVIRHSIDDLGALGAAEVIRSVPRHLGVLADLTRRFQRGRYDLVILLDYPGFHLRVARAATRAGVPVLYYIAPQLWAWRAQRAGELRRWVRELAVILPFEEAFFRNLQIPATFVGHPLLDQPPLPDRAAARKALGVGAGPVLAVFPGSRPSELRRLWPPFREAARIASAWIPELQVVVAGTDSFDYAGGENFVVRRGSPEVVLAGADAVLCKSGTTTLQAALAGTPMVIAYRLHALTYLLARRMVKTAHIGLVNLIARREVAPELIQGDATPEALARAVVPLLDHDGTASRTQRAALQDVRESLGTPGAGLRVAELAARMVA